MSTPLRTLAFLALTGLVPAAAQTRVISWGDHGDTALHDEVFTAVSAGEGSTAALRPDGTIATWGDNQYDQCQPPEPPFGLRFLEVDVGRQRNIGRLSDGTVEVWGDSPLPGIPPAPLGTSYVGVTAGSSTFVAALRSDGVVVLPSDLATSHAPPTPPAGVVYTRVRAGQAHFVALRSDGQIVSWDPNGDGPGTVPALPPGVVYTTFDTYRQGSAAVRSDGQIVVWAAKLGLELVPALPPGVAYVDVSVGLEHALAMRSDGVLVAWGPAGPVLTDVPALPPGVQYVQHSSGERHSAALRSDGKVVCWGHNDSLQLNIPELPPGVEYLDLDGGLALRSDGKVDELDPTGDGFQVPPLPPGTRYVQIEGGATFKMARRDDGQVAVWGSVPGNALPQPPPGVYYIDIAANNNHGLALRSDGKIATLGNTNYGLAGVPALPPGTLYTRVACGFLFNMALRTDGVLVGWGNSSVGQLTYPTTLPPGTKWFELAGSIHGGAGLLDDGQVLAWGDNQYGQTDVPPLPPGTAYTALEQSGHGYLALRSDGELVQWGALADLLPVPDLEPGWTWSSFGPGYAVLQPPCTVETYCTSKPSSIPGCVPAITWLGAPSLTSGHGFEIAAGPMPGQQIGLVIYTTAGSLATPLQTPYGELCLNPAQGLTRIGSLFDWDSTAGQCDGVLQLDFNVFLGKPFSHPSLVYGASVDLQFWYRDPPNPGTANLTEALRFPLCP